MIAIQSNKKLQFPPASVGFVTMEIDLIQNKPLEDIYEIRIIDTCFDIIAETKEVIENGQAVQKEEQVKKSLGTNTRFIKHKYAELNELGNQLNIDFSNNSKTIDNINQLFLQGLLMITKSECRNGISGQGKGMYFSEEQDWELV